MQKPFSTQPELFMTHADPEDPNLQGLDGAGAVLDRAERQVWPRVKAARGAA